jgi:proteasome assembly chaperone (PAC2) family protein
MDPVPTSELCYLDEPELNRPVLIMGFSGWPNAGEVSTETLRYLLARLSARPLAYLMPDGFFDFTSSRPTAKIEDGVIRELVLPKNEFYYIKQYDQDRDLILFLGEEPHLRWESFTGLVLNLAQDLGVETIYTVGGTYDYVPHWIEPRISAAFSSEEQRARFERQNEHHGLVRVSYQGPISIHSMILSSGRKRGMPVVGLWGHAPVYIHAGNLKVQINLIKTLTRTIHFSIDTTDLRDGLAQLDQKIQQLMEENPQLKKFIKELEKAYGRRTVPESQSSLMGSTPVTGKVISMDEFLNREKDTDA